MTQQGQDLEVPEESPESRARSRALLTALLVGIALAMGADIAQDFGEGAPLEHLLVEGFGMSAGLAAAAIVLREWFRERRRSRHLQGQLQTARADAEAWRREAAEALRGLGAAIDEQFRRWGLTEAEREVGLLLLKGLALKEIADLRATSERTVRQQALAVYRKGGLSGRAELSAFFLEDLLLPPAKAE